MAGGFYGDHPGVASDKVWRYDTVTDTWLEFPSLPEPRASGGIVVLDGKLHYFGAMSSDRMTDIDTHWTLDLSNPTSWQVESTFLYPTKSFSGCCVKWQDTCSRWAIWT